MKTAVKTSVARIGDDLDGFLGKCVTLTGPMTSIALYSSVEGLALIGRYGPDGNEDPVVARRHRIGLYSPNNEIRAMRLSGKGLRKLTVTGIVNSCKRMYDKAVLDARPDVIIMMGGYCHYHEGAVVHATNFTVDPKYRYARLVGEAARTKYGDLLPAPTDWPTLPVLRSVAEEFREALATGDRARLSNLHLIEAPRNEHDNKVLGSLLERPDSPFAQLRAPNTLPLQIFIHRYDFLYKRPASMSDALGTACFCRTKDCTDAWPITRSDADNDSDRPYACISIDWPDWNAGQARLDTQVSRGGWLFEPRETAFQPARD